MSLAHSFEIERCKREINSADPDALRDIALQMLNLLENQRAVFQQMVSKGWLPEP